MDQHENRNAYAAVARAGDPMTDGAVDELNNEWHQAFRNADDLLDHLQVVLGPAALASFMVEWRTLRTAGERLTMNLDMQAHVARARSAAAEISHRSLRDCEREVAELTASLAARTSENDDYRQGIEEMNARHNEVLKTLASWRKVGLVTDRMQKLLARRIDAAADKAIIQARARRNQEALGR